MKRSFLFIALMCACVTRINAQTGSFNINVIQIIQPQASEFTCDSVAPLVIIANTGTAPSPAFSMIFYIKNPSNGKYIYGPVSATVQPVSASGTAQVTFQQKFKTFLPGIFQMTAISQAGDNHPQDDTLTKPMTIISNFPSRQNAIALVQSEIISTSPYKTSLGAYLFLKHSSSDSLLMPGETVSDFDTTFVDSIANPTYLFFLDDAPMDYYYHPVTYVYVDACSGAIRTRNAETPPVIDGDVSRFDNDEENFVSGARCNRGALLPSTHLAATTNTSEWALIIPGPPLSRKGPWDSTAVPNDVERAKGYLNGDATGPQVNGGNIIVTNSPGEIGSTMQDVCNAITQIQGKNCTKVYLYYIGHGYNGGMVLRNPNGKGTSKFSYHDLACKLLNAGIQNVCIVIMACHSGSAINAMKDKEIITKPGTHIRLKGVIVTSSTSSNTTTGDSTGSPFMNAMSECGKDPSADQNKDGKVSLLEAWIWAQLRNDTLRKDGASCSQLDSGKITHIQAPDIKVVAFNDGGGDLIFEKIKIYYPPLIDPKTKKKTTVCRIFLYVSNPADNDHRAPNRIRISCTDAKGKKMELIPARIYDIPKHTRICLTELPADCKVSIDIVTGRNIPEIQPISFLPEERSVIQTRGEFLRERFSLPDDSGESYRSAIVSSPLSWSAGMEPSDFFVFDSAGESIFTVTALIPDSAHYGGNILASIISSSSGDTLLYPIRVLVFDSVHTPHDLNAFFNYNWVSYDTSVFQTLPGDTLILENSVLEFAPVDSLSSVTAHFRGYANFDGSHVSGPLYSNYVLSFDGPFDWTNSSAAGANGFRLGNSNALANINGGGIYRILNGLSLFGDQSKHSFNTLLIDSALGSGIYGIHALNCKMSGIRVERSAGNDISLDSTSSLTMIDCSFNPSKVSIGNTDTLIRAWTTVIVFSDTAGNPVKGIPVDIKAYSPLSVIDEKDTGNALGFVVTQIPEFIWVGSAHINFPTDTLRFSYNGKDSMLSFVANDQRTIEIILPPAKNAVQTEPKSAFQSSVYPNPSSGEALLNFVLSSPGNITIRLYDLSGKIIAIPYTGFRDAGKYAIDLNIQNLATGVYLYEIREGNLSEKGRFIKK